MSTYVDHARESALTIARQRGYQGHELNEAVESGALTDAEWCACLMKRESCTTWTAREHVLRI